MTSAVPTTSRAHGSDFAELSDIVKHAGLFRGRRANDAVGFVHAGLVGLSDGCWTSEHNRHHANPKHEDDDPDLDIRAGLMLRPSLRRAQPIVHDFCVERGISYSQSGLLRSYGHVLRHLHAVGAPLRAARR